MIIAASPFITLLRLAAFCVLVALPGAPEEASARGGGGGEVRATGSCGASATMDLRLRSRDGGIRMRLEVDHNRTRARWRVVLVQDRRVVWRGHATTRGAGDAFEIERRLRDLPGADVVTARAWGPAGVTCAATATLPG